MQLFALDGHAWLLISTHYSHCCARQNHLRLSFWVSNKRGTPASLS